MSVKEFCNNAVSYLKKLFKNKLEHVVGVYYSGDKIFAVNLYLKQTEIVDLNKIVEVDDVVDVDYVVNIPVSKVFEQWTIADSIEIPFVVESQEVQEMVAEKVAVICAARGWNTDIMALCLNNNEIITDIEDLSNVPVDKMKNAVHYQVAMTGGFESDNYLSAFMQVDNETWIAGISKVDAESWRDAWNKNEMILTALTAMPDEINDVNDINLINVESKSIEKGTLQAFFAANVVSSDALPDFFAEETEKISTWNFRNIAIALTLTVITTILIIAVVDLFDYRNAKTTLEIEKEELAVLETDRRKKEFIESDLVELDNKNKILAALSEEIYPWRSVLIHFGTVKIPGVWIREIKTVDNNAVEIKCEAISYNVMAAFVKKLESDTNFVQKGLTIKNSESRRDSHLVDFTMILPLN